jgi:quercetin dioxygenase-like cupin family protein
LDYVTDSNLPIQFGIHEPKKERISRIHYHKFGTEFFYVEKGWIKIKFTDRDFNVLGERVLNEGDAFVMYPSIGHEVYFPSGCRVIEVHQGPYADDKVFPEERIESEK